MAALPLRREDGSVVNMDALEKEKLSCPCWELELMIVPHIS